MASAEEMMQAVQVMQGQLQQLQSALRTERRRNNGVIRMAEAVKKMVTSQKGGGRLVDTRGIGRPGNFGQGDEKSLEKTFLVWQRKLPNYVVSVYPDLQEPMQWAVSCASQILDVDIDKAYCTSADALDHVEGIQDKDHQLYSVLMQLTEAKQTTSCATAAARASRRGGSSLDDGTHSPGAESGTC